MSLVGLLLIMPCYQIKNMHTVFIFKEILCSLSFFLFYFKLQIIVYMGYSVIFWYMYTFWND